MKAAGAMHGLADAAAADLAQHKCAIKGVSEIGRALFLLRV